MNQNVNHVDHVVWASHPETLLENMARLSELTGQQLMGPYDRPDIGARICLSWEGGIELVSPLDVVTPMADALRNHLSIKGEGLFAVIFGVPDIMDARARADKIGYQTSDIIESTGSEPWCHKTAVMKESVVGTFMGSLFLYGEILYNDGVFITKTASA